MEQGRVIIAIVLSFLVFFLWEYFMVDTETLQKAQKDAEIAQVASSGKNETDPAGAQQASQTKTETAAEVQKKAALVGQGRVIKVRTNLYTVEISEAGAALKTLVLKDYRETVDKDSDYKALISNAVHQGVCRTWFQNQAVAEMQNAVYQADSPGDQMDVFTEGQTLTFVWVSNDGIQVEKEFRFLADSYLIGMSVTVKNGSGKALAEDHLIVALEKKFTEDKRAYGFVGPSALINDKLEQIKTKKLKDKDTFGGSIKWIALQDRYFIESIINREADDKGALKISQGQDGTIESRLITGARTIGNGNVERYDFDLYFGPKSMRTLSGFDNGLDKAINFGMFDILAKPCLWLMNFLYGFIPNYGIAIIILTIITKVLLWPLGTKSYKSMGEMKKIQPLMAEIREKYKGDKKKMNQELMALYKVYKVNPMGGCLPMVVQIPVFFALYRMLYEAIELRHAPFFMWINDLSAPDRLFSFDFTIPFMEPPYGIPVLTIVMGATMFLQQKMTPTAGDPAQAKMMMFMPIIFTVIFINFSSGLVLYWLINNILSISQQYYIQKRTA